MLLTFVSNSPGNYSRNPRSRASRTVMMRLSSCSSRSSTFYNASTSIRRSLPRSLWLKCLSRYWWSFSPRSRWRPRRLGRENQVSLYSRSYYIFSDTMWHREICQEAVRREGHRGGSPKAKSTHPGGGEIDRCTDPWSCPWPCPEYEGGHRQWANLPDLSLAVCRLSFILDGKASLDCVRDALGMFWGPNEAFRHLTEDQKPWIKSRATWTSRNVS